MSWHLIQRDKEFPPGGFEFTDPRTKLRFNGGEANHSEQCRKILTHRLANPHLYPRGELGKLDLNSIATELDQQICARLGNNPRLCMDGNAPPAFPHHSRTQPSNQSCAKCGTMMTAIGCPTCASFRISSYQCPKCGFARGA